MDSSDRWVRPLFISRLVIVAGMFLFLSAMNRDLNHDEHQFLAPGALLAREGKLPYRDYPIFHLPNLILAYGVLDYFTVQPVLSAKILSTLGSVGVILLIGMVATREKLSRSIDKSGSLVAVLATVLLLGDQLFVFTAGKTWNHEVPAFLLVAGMVSQATAHRRSSLLLLVVSGLCVGGAVGTRLTYLPVCAAFPALLILAPWETRRPKVTCTAWLGGLILGLGPSLYFLMTHREAFLFDNFDFPRQRLLDPSDSRVQKTAAWWRKLRYFGKEIVAHSLPLFVASLAMVWQPVRCWWKDRSGEKYLVGMIVLVLPLALLGCFLPSRYQYQHYFIIIPLLALLIAASTDYPGSTLLARSIRTAALAVCAALSLAAFNADKGKRSGGARAYIDLVSMWKRENWFTSRLQEDYAFIRQVRGRTLTLAPAGVLQGGGAIYPEFATGPFAWRGAQRVPKEQRDRLHLVVPEDLEEYLSQQPPGGILTGVEDAELEKPLVNYAQQHGFRETKVGRKRILWLPVTSG